MPLILCLMDNIDEIVSQSSINLNDTETAFSYRSNEELQFSYFIFRMFKNSSLVSFFSSMGLLALKLRLPIDWIIKKTIFRQFCGGTSINDCESTIQKLGEANVGSILDYSVEAAQKETDFDNTRDELIKILKMSKGNSYIPFGCLKMTGMARHDILEKVSAGKELKPNEKELYLKALKRLETVCKTAYDSDTRLFIDAEETWIQVAIDKMAEAMMIKFNKEKPIVYTTLQMYRYDRIDYLNQLINQAKSQGWKLGVKFVRGAYLEKENLRAKEKGYPTPMQADKKSTDRDYNLALKISVENLDIISICAGSHNDKSCLYLTELMKSNKIAKDFKGIYFSQLYGMSDNISFVLGAEGYNVTKYLPYGPVRFTTPYLIRRAQENTSVAGQTGKELNIITQEIKRRKTA